MENCLRARRILLRPRHLFHSGALTDLGLLGVRCSTWNDCCFGCCPWSRALACSTWNTPGGMRQTPQSYGECASRWEGSTSLIWVNLETDSLTKSTKYVDDFQADLLIPEELLMFLSLQEVENFSFLISFAKPPERKFCAD